MALAFTVNRVLSPEGPGRGGAFEAHARDLTIGVEEELMLLDPETLDLSPSSAELVAATGGDARYQQELPASQIELTTPVCSNAVEIRDALLEARRDLLAAAAGAVRLAGAGTHPFAAAEGVISDTPRYREIAREYGRAAHRGLAWGTHVHVAISGAARAVAIHDALRAHLPELAALAGNAPFHEGRDTGLHSVRPKIAEAFPRQGIPPSWGSWGGYLEFLEWGSQTDGFAADGRQLWWEVRLHPGFGTLEVRVCDQQATAARSAALAAIVQALCSRLAAEHDAGALAPPAERERIEENRWRALRHGLAGTFLDYRTGKPVAARARLQTLLGELEPYAGRLGSGGALAGAAEMLAVTGSERQRACAQAHRGDLRALVEELACELEHELER